MPIKTDDQTLTKIQVEKLMNGVEQRFGLRSSERMAAKLIRILRNTLSHELARWVADLEKESSDHPDWQALIENLTVHETYFFRDEGQLESLRKSIMPDMIESVARQQFPTFKIWSAACSTGEEAYTLAIILMDVLLEAGHGSLSSKGEVNIHPRWNIQVLGTDISSPVLTTARAGHYTRCSAGLSSFRDLNNKWWNWFDAKPIQTGNVLGISKMVGDDCWSPKQHVKKITKFESRNLMDAFPIKNFNLICCRNALIYFSDENKQNIQEGFVNSLHNDGVLILGAADMLFTSRFKRNYCSKGLVHYSLST